jgi:hypothetical protein
MERCRQVELCDDNGILAGRFAPTVRKPVATLPSGRRILGMADAVVVNDPITGQGANNAAKCADRYLQSIVELGDGAPTADWMQQTFETYWNYAQHVVSWTNTMLTPPPPHLLKLLSAAGESPEIASIVANGFDDPRRFFPWWMDAAECQRFLGLKMAA